MRFAVLLSLSMVCGALPAHASDDPPVPAVSPAQATSTTPPSPASTPSSPPADGLKTTQPVSSVTTSPPTTTTTPAAQAPTADVVELANEKTLLSMGYKRRVHDGKVTFCRVEVVLGSHFEKKVCGTAEQLLGAQQLSKDVTEESQRQNNPLTLYEQQMEMGKH